MKIKPAQIKSWVSKHFEYKSASNGRQVRICSPDDDAGWHLWINLELAKSKRNGKVDYWVHDFRPNHRQWDGSFVRFVQQYKKISYFGALKEICGNKNNAIEILREAKSDNGQSAESDAQEPEEKLVKLPQNSKLASDGKGKAHQIALNYLKQRLVSVESIKIHQIHYTSSSLIFPYIEYGMVVYWQQRSIINKQFLFPDAKETKSAKTDFLYGFDDVEPGQAVFVCESIFDCLSLGANTVALGGAVIAGRQLRKLRALNPSAIILVPDNDRAGISSLAYNHERLTSVFGDIRYCLPPKGKLDLKDWNEYDQAYGAGWSRQYISENMETLNMLSKLRPTVKICHIDHN